MYIIKLQNGMDKSNETYMGKVWDNASIRHLYKPFYESRKEADEIASVLNLWSSVGTFRTYKTVKC